MALRATAIVVFLALGASRSALAHGPDGMTLLANRGPGPEDVSLDWTGGQPVFQVFRSTDKTSVISPPNMIGETPVRSWVDAPPPATIHYYQIVSPCVYAPPEVCDGADNDCDGTIDGPPAEAACDDASACTVDSCHSFAGCAHVSRDACAEPVCALPPGCGFVDSDGDGLNDTWESNGYIDINCDGMGSTADGDLFWHEPPAVGTKDLYVEYDFMVQPGSGAPCLIPADCPFSGEQCSATGVCTGHSHDPGPAAVQLVVDAFGARGIVVHVDPVHDALEHHAVVQVEPAPPSCSGPDAVDFNALKSASTSFPRALAPAYHWLVFGHHNTCPDQSRCDTCPPLAGGTQPRYGMTGLAERPGNDLIVSFGAYIDAGLPVTDLMVGGTFMHELGHNLALRHGGGDDLVQKPNHFSVMNYSYQFGIPMSPAPGPYPTSPLNPAVEYRIDFSDRVLDPLQEFGIPGITGGLDELFGVSGPPGSRDVTVFRDGPMVLYAPSNGTPVNWNNNAFTGELHVVRDVSGDGSLDLLAGSNDWASLVFGFQCSEGTFEDGVTELDLGTVFLRVVLSDRLESGEVPGAAVAIPAADVAMIP